MLQKQDSLILNFKRTSIMKKIYLIAFTVLATLALGSCVQEIQDDNTSNVALAENGIAFVMNGGPATRADEGTAVVSQGVTIPLGKTENGTSLYLEETVTNLDAVAPVTRGTPAYTENLGVLYANQLGVHADQGNFGELAFNSDSEIKNGYWRYSHVYDSDPWPANENTPVKFYLRMPADINGFTVTNGESTATYAPDYDGESISITYYSPKTAADMQDILFGYKKMSKSEYKGLQAEGGAKVTLYHALTGIKFRIGNTAEDFAKNTISIDEISFVGLKDYGTCVITPSAGSSASAAVWSDLGVTEGAVFSSGEYGTPVEYSKDGGSFGDGVGSYPNSFANANDYDKNLNDAAATQTFWLIPQVMTADIRLKITYTFDGNQTTGYLNFGKILAESRESGVEWKAGELRTYTIRVEDVNVQIDDVVEIDGSEDDGFKGSTKSQVVIKNTGNTKAFIRAAIVGQWLDYQNNPVFGFTDKVNNLYIVESWYEDQFVNEDHEHGFFVGLPGYLEKSGTGETATSTRNPNPNNGWQLCTDGYYYYLTAVDPGAATGGSLFTSYEVGTIPNTEIAGAQIDHKEMHFELEIATQAISALQSNGEPYTWADAWANALGSAPVKK